MGAKQTLAGPGCMILEPKKDDKGIRSVMIRAPRSLLR